MISDEDVTNIVRAHYSRLALLRDEWAWTRAAYKTKFWEEGHQHLPQPDRAVIGSGDSQPIKIEANKIQPFVSALVASLYYRKPQSMAELPGVLEVEVGRPEDLSELPDGVSALVDYWLNRARVKKASTQAYELSLLYGWSAFKLGIRNGKTDVVSRSFCDAIPPWDCVWDPRAATAEQQAYRGHIRWEMMDRARVLLQDELKDVQPMAIPDYLVDGRSSSSGDLARAYKGYVPLLEWYDFEDESQQMALLTGAFEGAEVVFYGEKAPIPWNYADDRPGCPIVPIVLSNVPEHPMEGLPAARRIARLSVEENQILTIIANALRREAGRIGIVHPDAPDELWQALKSGKDLEFIKAEDLEGAEISELVHILQMPSVAATLDKALSWFQQARLDSSGTSGIQEGKQLKYATATEAGLIAAYGEAAASEPQSRMAEAMAEAAGLNLRIWGTMLGKKNGLKVRVGAEHKTLRKKDLLLNWSLSILDSTASPVKDARLREAFLQVQPQMMTLANLASGKLPDGSPVAPPVQRLAQEMLNWMPAKWGLPPEFTWDALTVSSQKLQEERDKETEKLVASRAQPGAVAPPGAAGPQGAQAPDLPLPPQG